MLRMTDLLARRDELPLLLGVVHPSTGPCFAASLLREAFDSLLKLGPEMSDETLQWPRKGFPER